MKTISIGALRQNPTQAFDEVERGETYVVTRYRKEIGRIVPPARTAHGVSGNEVMAAMRRTPLQDDSWAEELTRDRAADVGTDPWARM